MQIRSASMKFQIFGHIFRMVKAKLKKILFTLMFSWSMVSNMTMTIGWSEFVIPYAGNAFADYRAERNMLAHKAYPLLQEFCQQHNLQFQVVDLRWGVTDNVTNDHQVEALCIQEIQNCHTLSLGPNFVVSHVTSPT